MRQYFQVLAAGVQQLQRPLAQQAAKGIGTVHHDRVNEPGRSTAGKLDQSGNRVKGLLAKEFGIQRDHLGASHLGTGGIQRLGGVDPADLGGQGHAVIRQQEKTAASIAAKRQAAIEGTTEGTAIDVLRAPPMGTP